MHRCFWEEPWCSSSARPLLGAAAAQDQKGDQMIDWIGLGADEPTAVEETSWGRVKSHLQGQLE